MNHLTEPDLPSPGQIVGREYLRSQTLEQRRVSGRVYTPPHLVDFLLEQAGYEPSRTLEDWPLLDPACGAGVFLERAVVLLHSRFRVRGRNTANAETYSHFLSVIERNLWGIDADARCRTLACEAVRATVEALTGRRPPEPFFRDNVLTADFLLDPSVERFAPVRGKRLAFLVGNPPYVAVTRIERTYRERLRSRFEAAQGRLDLYTVFMERALAISPPAARIAFVTPDKFLTSYSARGLRSYILRTSAVRTIALFKSDKVFREAAIVPSVTVLERDGAKTPVRVLMCRDRPESGRVTATEARTIQHSSLDDAPWNLLSSEAASLVKRLRSGHRTLEDVALRISAGPATGRDRIFVFPRDDHPEIEPELLRPAVRGRDISAYYITDPQLTVLIPYLFGPLGAPDLIPLKRFPGAARYLDRHRSELSGRHCVRVWGKSWYDLHDSPSIDLASQPKILVPDVAISNRFAIDRGAYFPLHSTYYILPKPGIDLDYLVAVLNSSVAAFLIKAQAPVVKDGFNRYRQQFTMSLPVPSAPADLRRSIVRSARHEDGATVNSLVKELFGLSRKDGVIVDGNPRLDSRT